MRDLQQIPHHVDWKAITWKWRLYEPYLLSLVIRLSQWGYGYIQESRQQSVWEGPHTQDLVWLPNSLHWLFHWHRFKLCHSLIDLQSIRGIPCAQLESPLYWNPWSTSRIRRHPDRGHWNRLRRRFQKESKSQKVKATWTNTQFRSRT